MGNMMGPVKIHNAWRELSAYARLLIPSVRVKIQLNL